MSNELEEKEEILRYRYASVPPEDTCSLVSGEARKGPECESWRPPTRCEGKSQVLKTCTEEDLDKQEHRIMGPRSVASATILYLDMRVAQ